MMKTLTILLLLLPCLLAAQPMNKQAVIQSGHYYYGEGTSADEREATDAARTALVQSIAVTVSSSFEHTVSESNTVVQSSAQSIMRSYSLATLKNLHSLESVTDGLVSVFCYIDKNDVHEIFEGRKRMVVEIYQEARELEDAGDIGQALKLLYFAAILMKSVPEQEIRTGSTNLVLEVPQRINAILEALTFAVKSNKNIDATERELRFEIRAGQRPVRSIEFSFWDGTEQVNVQALDGEGIVSLYGSSVGFDKLDIKVKYAYYENRGEISEVEALWNVVEKPTFMNTKHVSLTELPSPALKPKTSESNTGSLELANGESCGVTIPIGKVLRDLVTFLNRGDEESIKQQYRSDPFLTNKLIDLVRYNRPTVVHDTIDVAIHKTATGWEARRMRVITRYKSLNKQAGEYLIADFTPEGRLEDVNFGIMDELYREFVEEGKALDDWEQRQVMIKFMERYRTAYLTRNMAMLDSLFADDAVIIIGRIMKKSGPSDAYAYKRISEDQPDFQTIRYTKEQYLKNQRITFKNQADIFVGYNSFKMLRKNNQPGVYGISMRQNYASTTYADEGYLFLLVDFNGAYPQIYVRSWQPKEWNDDSLIKLSNFHLNR